MKWNGRYYSTGYGRRPYPPKEDSIEDLLKPLSEKTKKGNVWIPVKSQILNVYKDSGTPIPFFEPEYQSVLNFATSQGYTLPSEEQQDIQNQLVSGLKTTGIWNDLDIFYVFATDGDENFAKIDWKNPSSSFYITEYGSVSFITNVGFVPAALNVANYLDTNYNPVLHSTAYTQNDACRFVWDYDNTIAGFNVYDGTANINGENTFQGATGTNHRINSESVALPVSFDNSGVGLKVIQRTSSTTVNMYKNSATPTTFTVGSRPMTNSSQRIFSRPSGGTSLRKLSFYGMGASLNGKIGDLLTQTTTYMSTI